MNRYPTQIMVSPKGDLLLNPRPASLPVFFVSRYRLSKFWAFPDISTATPIHRLGSEAIKPFFQAGGRFSCESGVPLVLRVGLPNGLIALITHDPKPQMEPLSRLAHVIVTSSETVTPSRQEAPAPLPAANSDLPNIDVMMELTFHALRVLTARQINEPK